MVACANCGDPCEDQPDLCNPCYGLMMFAFKDPAAEKFLSDYLKERVDALYYALSSI